MRLAKKLEGCILLYSGPDESSKEGIIDEE